MKKTIIVKPVPRISAQNRHEYYYRDGETAIPAGRTKARNAADRYGFVSAKDGKNLKTGMDKIITNPYYNKSIDEVAENIRPKGEWELQYEQLSSTEKITMQTYLEIVHNQPKGTYSPVRTMSDMTKMKPLNKEHLSSFLEEFGCRLVDGTNIFTSGTPDNDLAILVVENHPKIAPSREDVNPDMHNFYIANVDEELVEETKLKDRFMELVAAGQDLLDNMDSFVAYQVGVILKLFKGKPTMTAIRKVIQEFVTTQARTEKGTLEERYQMFMEIYKLAKGDTEARAKMYVMYLIRQAINESIFHVSKGSYFWVSQKDNENWYALGSSYKTIIDRFIQEYVAYDPGIVPENFFAYLEEEVGRKNLQVNNKK